jgi:hypothetical protein
MSIPDQIKKSHWGVWIVVAVCILILIAIAIPSFVKARNTSSQQACINNLRIIGVGIALVDWEQYEQFNQAIEGFIKERQSQGLSIPSSVPFRELVSSGEVWDNCVKKFGNADVAVLFGFGTNQASPKAIGVRVRFADGVEMTQWADGRFDRNPSY